MKRRIGYWRKKSGGCHGVNEKRGLSVLCFPCGKHTFLGTELYVSYVENVGFCHGKRKKY